MSFTKIQLHFQGCPILKILLMWQVLFKKYQFLTFSKKRHLFCFSCLDKLIRFKMKKIIYWSIIIFQGIIWNGNLLILKNPLPKKSRISCFQDLLTLGCLELLGLCPCTLSGWRGGGSQNLMDTSIIRNRLHALARH